MPTISARLVCAATLVAIGIAGCRDEPTALPESPGSALETSASDQPPTTADGLPAEWRDSIIAYTGSDSSSQASSASVEGGAAGGPSLAVIAGMPDLRDACGSTVTGVAFDGTYIYVAEGGNQNMCIGRFSASGALVDFKRFSPDFRGLTYVPSLGKLVGRTWGGWGGQLYAIDYAAGSAAQLTSYDIDPSDNQNQPAVEGDGASYWIRKTNVVERRRISDNALLKSFPVTGNIGSPAPWRSRAITSSCRTIWR